MNRAQGKIPFTSIVVVALAALLLAALPASADDRDLLRDSVSDPYVFIIFDTSGSMHWTPPCTASDTVGDIDPFDGACTYECTMGDPKCERLCPSWGCVEYTDPTDATSCVRMGYRCQQSLCPGGDCFANLNGDDPSSKLFQAKQAMFEVLQQVDNVQFGFATYEQDSLRLESKHWLYQMRDMVPDNTAAQSALALPGGAPVLSPGDQLTFGRGEFQGWNCIDTSNGNGRISCEYNNPSDLGTAYDMERLRRMPKLGLGGTGTRTSYVRESFNNSLRYRLTFAPASGDTHDASPNGYTYGEDFIAVDVTLEHCDNPGNVSGYNCTGTGNATFISTTTLYFDLVSDFLAWDAGAFTGPVKKGYNAQSMIDFAADNTCGGWDSNTDSSSDDYRGLYNFRWPTPCDTNPAFCDSRGAAFNRGDVIPLDWLDDNKAEIMQRFSPNQINPAEPPDFRSAFYFNDDPNNPASDLNRHLTHVDPLARPIVSQGLTPLGASLADFRNWYDTWSGVAAQQDPDWACRRKFVLFITDGDETCGGNACSETALLAQQRGVRTFVVGFGLSNSATLSCMASNGGTGQPIFPRNKDDLVDALTRIFSDIRSESRAFASASVPAIQSTAADKIFLSSFIPLPSASIWPGRLDAFRLPLVLTPEGTPDIDRQCTSTIQSGCHLWNAGEVLLTQAPTAGEIAGGSRRLGGALTQRRLFYGKQSLFNPLQPGGLRLLDYPTTPLDQADLRAVFLNNLDDQNLANTVITIPQADQIVRSVIDQTLVIKEDVLVDPSNGSTTPIQYVLGDVFHANPKISDSPKEGRFFLSNQCGVDAGENAPANNCVDSSFFSTPEEHAERGYQSFVERFLWRRRMLIVPSNDGQLHFFDAGIRKSIGGQDVFTDGTGTELFSYMPRLAMPIVRDLARDNSHIYSVDSTVTVKDVFVDPVRPLQDNQREWRTIIVGGMREAGKVFEATATVDKLKSGYYALDITQPDELQQIGTVADPKYVPSPEGETLPSCLTFNVSTGNLEPNASCATLSGEQIEFPKELWSFTDRYFNLLYVPFGNGGLYELDEDLDPNTLSHDGNGFPDLGETWSEPVIGPVRVCPDVLSNCDPTDVNNELTTRWVAIFGGGMDTESKAAPRFGNFLYMVDIETGEAIYKRQLDGAAPATPTVLDKDNDGNLDTIYIGTTEGFFYKVDLEALDSSGEVPALEDHTLRATNLLGASALAPDVTVQRITDEAWDPFKIFDTGGRPLYIAATALFIPEREQYALAFGSGDRDDLWDFNGQDGRFYLVLDDDFDRLTAISSPTPTEADFQLLGFDAALNPGADFVLNSSAPRPGWVITLPADVRVTARSFGLLGVLIFTAFEPQVVNVTGDIDGDGIPDTACARTGVSRVFAINARNADAVAPLSDPSGAKTTLDGTDRFSVISDFTTAPFVTDTATKNPPGSGPNTNQACKTPAMEIMMQRLKRSFFPRNCNFNDAIAKCVALNESGTVLRDVAKIPTAVCPADWSLGEPVWLQHQPVP